MNHHGVNRRSLEWGGWITSWNSTLIVPTRIVYRKRGWKWIDLVFKMKTTVVLKWKSITMIMMKTMNRTSINFSKIYDLTLIHEIKVQLYLDQVQKMIWFLKLRYLILWFYVFKQNSVIQFFEVILLYQS